jgi:hypothetical protein
MNMNIGAARNQLGTTLIGLEINVINLLWTQKYGANYHGISSSE